MTTADQLPPPDTRSVTKNQPTTAVIEPGSGWRKLCRAQPAAIRTSSSSPRRATEKPANGEPDAALVTEVGVGAPENQPNHVHSAPRKTPHATTDAKPNTPAASQRPRRSSPRATTFRTAKTSTAQPA